MKSGQTSPSDPKTQKESESLREFVMNHIQVSKRTLNETHQLLKKVGLLNLLLLFLVSSLWITYVIYFNHVSNFVLWVCQGNVLVANLLLPVFQSTPLFFCFHFIFKKNYRSLFSKVRISDSCIYIALGILIELAVSLLIVMLLKGVIKPNTNPIVDAPIGISLYSLPIGLVGEQIFFFSVCFFFFLLCLKLKCNMNLAAITTFVLGILIFGVAHLSAYNGNALQCILLIGFPFTLIQVLLFLRSGNLMIGYLEHLFFDLLVIFIARFG